MTRGSRTRSVKPRSYGEHVATVGAHTTRKSSEKKIMSRSFQKTPVMWGWKNGQSKRYKRATAKRRRAAGFDVLKGHLIQDSYDLKEIRRWKPNRTVRK